MHYAWAYGYFLQSNVPIPGLSRAPDRSARVSLRIRLDASPPWGTRARSARTSPGRPGHEKLSGGRHVLRYADGTTFWLDASRATIWSRWPATLTLEDTATYLLGPVLGWYLRLRGHLCLHASAIATDEDCVAFVGSAGSGKSTLAAALAAGGSAVVTEDVACCDEKRGAFWMRPGYPMIRLWPGSGELLALRNLPRLTPNWGKRYLELGTAAHRFRHAPARLAAVFILTERRPLAVAAEIRPLPGQDALAALLANTYGQPLASPAMRANEFSLLGLLARSVPVRSLTLNADGSRLAEACDWIRHHALA
jgi:hypothetical protein